MKSLSLHLIAAAAIVGLGACNTFEPETRSSASSSTSTSTTTVQEPRTKEAAAPKRSSARAPKGMVISSVAFPTGDVNTSALLVEKVLPKSAQLGAPITYETRVTNLAAFMLDNVIVSETADPNFSLTSSEPRAASTGSQGTEWRLGNMAPNSTRTILVTGQAKSEKSIQNCVSVSYSSALCSSIPVTAPKLLLVASGPSEVLACDKLEYTYVVTNPGSGSADNVVVNATLPSGLTVNGKTSFSRNIGTLEAGKSSQFKVTATPSRTGRFEHVAKATGSGNLKADSKNVGTTVRKPKLQIAMTGPKTRLVGRDATYKINVKNTGDGVARKMILETIIPSGTKVKSSTQGAKLSGNTLSWNLGEMPAGKQTEFQLKLATSQIGKIALRSNAKAYCADTVSATASTKLDGIPAILLEVIDIEDPIEVGSNLTYVVSVTNQGTAPATNVNIAIQLPPNVSFVQAKGATKPAGGAAVGRSLKLLPVTSLAPKAEAIWRIEVKGDSAADARFKVSMTSDQLSSPVEESEATTFYN